MEIFWASYIGLMLIPAFTLLAGIVMWKYAPTHLHTFVGFRTERAMQDGETWKYANTTAGRLLVKYGVMILVISAVLPVFFLNAPDASFQALTIVLLCTQVCVIVVCLVATQIMLVRKYPKDAFIVKHKRKRR